MKKLTGRLLRFLAPRLAYWYLMFVGRTSKIEWRGTEYIDALEKEGQHFGYALWHGRQVFFTYSHRNSKGAVMVSRSKDGDIIAEVMRRFGLLAIRGSSSKDSARALKELVDVCREGYHPATTPDGPRGPAGQVKPGILFLARELGIPIVPISSCHKWKLVFHGWDEYHFPLPFSRVVIVHGPPLYVRPGDSMREKARELKRSLDEATRIADEAALKG